MKPLYALIVQHKHLEQIDPEDVDEEVLLKVLQELEGEIAVKAKSVAAYVRNVECFAEAVEDAAKKMQARANKLNARAAKVREYLLQQMLQLGTDEISSPEFTIKIKKNPPSVVIDDETKIPQKYKHTPPPPDPVIDKAAIKRDLAMGDEVPGAHLNQGKRLDIKE